MIKQLLVTISKTYQRNNFGTMKTWNSPKKLTEDYNEAPIFNYLTLVSFISILNKYKSNVFIFTY